jgi:phosphoglycolate phosphatase
LKLLVFDLDGTLIDSAQDLCNSVNATLAHIGREPLADAVVAGYIGDGAVMLVRRALFGPDATEVDEELLAQAYAWFLIYYREHKLDYTYAYEGVLEALAALRQLHEHPDGPARLMAVLTNKPVCPGPSAVLPAHLRRQQLCHQEARSAGTPRADGRGRGATPGDGGDRRQPGGCGDGAQRGRMVHRLHLRPGA